MLKRRISKLEAEKAPLPEHQVVFISAVELGGSEYVFKAIVPGSNIGSVDRAEHESEVDFRRRAYALKRIKKPIQDVTDAELAEAIAANDEDPELRDEILGEETDQSGNSNSAAMVTAVEHTIYDTPHVDPCTGTRSDDTDTNETNQTGNSEGTK